MLTNLFQGLREYAIASRDLETANKLVPFESLQGLRSCESLNFDESLQSAWAAYFTKVLEFPDPYREFAKQKNCTPGKSYACKATCISINKNCLNPLPGQAQSYAAFLAMTSGGASSSTPATTAPAPKKTTKKSAAPTATANQSPTNAQPSNTPIKTNAKELNDKRNYLVKQFGQKTVDAAEQNVHKILNDPDTSIYIRAGSTDTLDKILNGGFKTSAELNIQSHNIPFLNGNYQDARNRVEAKVMGYDEKNTAPGDRPIYGYLGGSDLSGKSHQGTDAYGEITIKLKPQVKDRSTFTGSDSFKSGIASEVVNKGNPPPPNAASLVSSTRHGYDKDKLPGHYPTAYKDKSGDGRQLTSAVNAKSIDDLPGALAPTGNAYLEAQIHGKVQPSDIAEIHFKKVGGTNGLTQDALDNAHKLGIKVYVNGKEFKPGTKLKADNDAQKINSALDAGDFNAVLDLTEDVTKKANALKKTPANQHDPTMAYLASQNGFADKPKVVTDKDVTSAWQQGGHLLIRGVANGFLKPFIDDDYYVGGAGGTMYGNGQYAWHSGKAKSGQKVPPPPVGYDPKTAAKDAKDAFDTGDRLGYINIRGETIRMALPKDANITTQTSMVAEIKALDQKIDAWAAQERQKIAAKTGGSTTSSSTSADEIKQRADDAKKFKKTLGLVSAPGFYPTSRNPQKLQLQPKKKGAAPEDLPPSFEISDSIVAGRGAVGTVDLVTPLGKYRILSKTKAMKLAYEDHVKLKIATKQVEKDLSQDYNLSQPLSVMGTYLIAPKNIPSTAKPIDTGMSVERDPQGKWILKETARGIKINPPDGFKSKADAEKELIRQHIEKEAVKMIVGGKVVTANSDIAEFDKKVRKMKDMLYGDSHGMTTPSGRYAVIKGYDGVMANDSYEPKRMFVIYNRGKALVQRNSLDYNQGKKTGAA